MENCSHSRAKRFGRTKSGEQRYRCLDCGKTFVESTRKLDGMTIGTDKAAFVVRCLGEGVGVRGTTRLAGVAKNTLLDLLVLLGERCAQFSEGTIVGMPVKDVQIDELWSFVGCKERTRKLNSMPVGSCGDQYCFTALERKTKLLLAWHMGDRVHSEGVAFVRKLARACASDKFQISSDGWSPYKHLIPNHMGSADYGMIIKIFTGANEMGRYSPGRITEVKRKRIAGNPDETKICTSHCERFNLSIRMGLRRFTRLTNGFSRKLANHRAALALNFAYYNFCAKHGTIKTTPAVAAGIADAPWTAEELIERTATYAPPKPQAPTWGEFLEGIPDDE